MKVEGRIRDFVILLDKFIYILGKHWLFAVNWAIAIYVGLPLLAPVLMQNGYTGLGNFIYDIYGPPVCHQLPERSFFLYGPQPTYTVEELDDLAGEQVPLRYTGNPEIGQKIGICQRCLAIYLTLLFGGIAFGLVRGQLRPPPWQVMILFLLPMAIDGTGQLVGLWESTWLKRTITGVLASTGLIWLVYPVIEEGMRDVQVQALKQLDKDRAKSCAGSRPAAGGKDEEHQAKAAQDEQREQLVQTMGDE